MLIFVRMADVVMNLETHKLLQYVFKTKKKKQKIKEN